MLWYYTGTNGLSVSVYAEDPERSARQGRTPRPVKIFRAAGLGNSKRSLEECQKAAEALARRLHDERKAQGWDVCMGNPRAK